jgi:microcystin-dependent protein
MAVYPNSVRAFTTHIDLSENVFALHVNDLQDELVAVQAELGPLPKGTAATVRARLDGLDSGKSGTGHDHANRLDNVLHDVAGRHQFGSALGTPATPTAENFGDTAAVGVGAYPPHDDHRHRMPTVREGQDALIPAGVIWEYGGTNAPAGWLFCNGASVLRADYPQLFSAIGVRYGSVDGTHFTLPNRLGRTGIGAAGTGDAVSTGGYRDSYIVSHNHPGSGVGNGSADHQHWVSHGHHVADNGNHRHMDDLGFNYAWRAGGTQNDYFVNQAGANKGAAMTFTEHRYVGSHGHNTDTCDRGYSDGATNSGAYHGHGLTIALDGVGANGVGPERNLPPYETCNYIIKAH